MARRRRISPCALVPKLLLASAVVSFGLVPAPLRARLRTVPTARIRPPSPAQKDYSEAAKWVVGLMARSGTEKEGGFTEAQLQELMRESEPKKKANLPRNALASALRLRRKIERTINESMDELNRQRKSLWWSRWIPRQE